jgi:outer membrane protein OmpA-like peptidoglycan-associated protein
MTFDGKGFPAISSMAALIGAGLLAGCQSLPKMHMPGPMIHSPPSCADFAISIYFEPGSAAVTPEAQALIRSATGHARRCQVQGIDVVGLADAPGAPDANLQLSKDRAAAVTAALAAHRLEHVEINSTALGDEGAQLRGERRPLRRRVNVTFHMSAPPPR